MKKRTDLENYLLLEESLASKLYVLLIFKAHTYPARTRSRANSLTGKIVNQLFSLIIALGCGYMLLLIVNSAGSLTIGSILVCLILLLFMLVFPIWLYFDLKTSIKLLQLRKQILNSEVEVIFDSKIYFAHLKQKVLLAKEQRGNIRSPNKTLEFKQINEQLFYLNPQLLLTEEQRSIVVKKQIKELIGIFGFFLLLVVISGL